MSQTAMEWLRILISVVSIGFAIYMGLRGNRKSDDKEVEARIQQDTRMNIKLDEVISTSRDTRDSVHELRKEIQGHNDRLIAVEESLKSLHHRVNTLEGRLNNGGS